MSDYIKRDDATSKQFRYLLSNGVLTPPVVFVKDIENLPAADVVERKVGKWMGGEIPYMTEITPLGRHEHYYYSCSVCKHGQGYKTPYCPHCGADMRSTQRNDSNALDALKREGTT